MSCCSHRLRRTSPMDGSSRAELIVSKPPRMNGWSWPLQPFQVLAWILYSYLAIVSFGIYIPLLPLPWKQLIFAVSLNARATFVDSPDGDKDFVVRAVCARCSPAVQTASVSAASCLSPRCYHCWVFSQVECWFIWQKALFSTQERRVRSIEDDLPSALLHLSRGHFPSVLVCSWLRWLLLCTFSPILLQ